MKKVIRDTIYVVLWLMVLFTLFMLAFVVFYIVKEALPLLKDVSLGEFLLGNKWMPVDVGVPMAFGIRNFILGTLYVSAVAVVLASGLSIGVALYLSCAAGEAARRIWYPIIDLLAGIPSVVFGFVGLTVLARLFLRLGHPSGISTLTAGIVLAVMILPYLVSSISETMVKLKARYMPASVGLGVDKWYSVAHLIFPLSWRSILLSMVLAISRAMGETMAVMMVMGNANMLPTLLGKGESIASLIALEMGTAIVDSTHYHALYGAGLVLMLLLLLINGGISLLRWYLKKKGALL